jgi:hypothetical protein
MLDALGNIGDLLGGLGVIVTLIYLAIQIRQNTKSSRSQSYQAAVSAVSDWSREVGMNTESCRVLQAGSMDLESLSDVERAQFNLIMASLIRNCENIHYQHINGAIDANTWSGWAKRTRSVLAPGGAQAWWRNNKSAYSPEFRRFVDEGHDSGELPESIVIYRDPAA